MSHIRIILGAKLDCVGATFNLATEAHALKKTAFTADDLITGAVASETNETIHAMLEDIQALATDWCDNGSSLSESDMRNVLNDYKTDLEALM